MRLAAILLLSSMLLIGSGFGQTRTITGKVINDELQPIYQARINNVDTVYLAETDLNGNFKIDIPDNTKSLIISGIALEWKLINLAPDCTQLELIMLNRGSYDFMSARKVDRLRRKYFETLPKLHQSAYDKSIFKMAKPCYVDKFIPIRQRLEEIHRARTQMPST